MTDREFISEVLRISETVFDAHIQSDEIDNLCHQYKTELAVAPVNTAQHAQPAICPTCAGKGWYMVGPTLFPEQVQCEDCYGTGKQQA